MYRKKGSKFLRVITLLAIIPIVVIVFYFMEPSVVYKEKNVYKLEPRKGTIDFPDLPPVSKWETYNVTGADGDGFETIIPPGWEEGEVYFPHAPFEMDRKETVSIEEIFDLSKSRRLSIPEGCEDVVILYRYEGFIKSGINEVTSYENNNGITVYQELLEAQPGNFISYIDDGRGYYTITSDSSCPVDLAFGAAETITQNFKLIQ